MSVQAVKSGLRVDEVYRGSPAQKGGLKVGDLIVSVNGRSLAGKTSDESTALIKGPAGSAVRLGVRDGERVRELRLQRAKVDIPIVQSRIERSGGKPIALGPAGGLHVGLGRRRREGGARRARAGRAGRRAGPARQRRRPAQRGGDGRLHLHPRRPDRLDQGPRAPRARLQRHRRRDRDQDPRRGARRRGVGIGVGDRHRRAPGPQAREGRRHAHVRQGRLPGDRAARQRRRARHHGRRVLHARAGATSAAAASSKGAGVTPDVKASDDPKTRPRRGPAHGAEDGRASSCDAPRARAAGPRDRPVVGVLEKHGRFLAAAPFFERGQRRQRRASRGATRAPATSCWSRRARGGRGEGRAPDRAPGRRARRDRGADARPRAAAAASTRSSSARRALRRRRDRGRPRTARPARSCRRSRSTRRRAKDFDDAISAEELRGGAIRVWVHIADVSAYVKPGSAVDREAFRRANVRLRAGRGRADAARGAVQPRVLARPRRGPPDGHGRARARRREPPPQRRSTAR